MKIFKFSNPIVLLACTSLMFFSSTAQNTVYVLNYYKTNFIFGSGFWVYQDTATLETDSITLDNVKHGFYGPNPVIQYYREYYQLEYYSHTNDSAFNDFFIENLWRVNGGGEWAELGQPVMLANNYGPLFGGYNGFEILEIMDSLVVGNNTFYDIARSHIFENQQYQHEFNFDTDLFYADDVGIIRKAYTDNEGVNHSWDLVNWGVGWITDVDETSLPGKEAAIYPNPASGCINIVSIDPVRFAVCSLQGDVLLEGTGHDVDITNLADGIYLVRVYSQTGPLLKVEKVIKNMNQF